MFSVANQKKQAYSFYQFENLQVIKGVDRQELDRFKIFNHLFFLIKKIS